MKLDRMIGILAVLLQQEKVTAPWLAEKFEVSRRTINRDIERLCMAGIPIVTSRGAGGGISISFFPFSFMALVLPVSAYWGEKELDFSVGLGLRFTLGG